MTIAAFSSPTATLQGSIHPTHPINRKPKLQTNLIHFGRVADTYAIDNRIPNDVYNLFLKAPKNELHVHQGGSSSVEFLIYKLREAIEKGEIDTLPLYHPNGQVEIVNLNTDAEGKPLNPEQSRAVRDRVLTLDNMRNYYRFQLEMDDHRNYMDSKDIAETTAQRRPGKEIISAKESAQLQKQKEQGLTAYRETSKKINPYVKNNPAAYLLANDYAKNLALENVRYSEYRISPSGNGLGGANGSNIEEVLSAVDRGFKDAQAQLNQRTYPFDYGLLVLFERQNRSKDEPPETKVNRAVQLAKDVVRLKKEGKYNIVGVDLAGDEANNPVTEFKAAFDVIKEYNRTAKPDARLGITIHAGETAHSKNPSKQIDLQGFESIAKAIEIAHDANTPVRIGHGLQVVNSSPALRKAFEAYRMFPSDWEKRIDKKALLQASPLLKQIVDRKIVLEMCPKSNLQTYGIHPGFPDNQFEVNRDEYSAKAYSRHPAVFLSRLGVKVAISSDNRTISNTDVTNEFVKLYKYAGLTYQDFKKMVMNGFEGAFIADRKKKEELIEAVKLDFSKMEKVPARLRTIAKMGGQLGWRSRWTLFKETWTTKLSNLYTRVSQWFTNLYRRIFRRGNSSQAAN